MKSCRPLSINNSLVHGICNYHCRLCGINKSGYNGPKEFQPYIVTKTLIKRIEEAAQEGITIRYIANSGDGESTLHPEFADRMNMFGKMLKGWNYHQIDPPEVSVVTNGSQLHQPKVMKSFLENNLTMIISLPTLIPDSYGLIMTGNPGKGDGLLTKVIPGICEAMLHRAKNILSDLYFHVSPPETDIIRRDFPETLNKLTQFAAENQLGSIQLVMFPAPSNRSGLVGNKNTRIDMYKDLFNRFHGTVINGVTVHMNLVLHRFFTSIREIADLIKNFDYPCLWNANFFFSSDGSSICCNDQSVRAVQGNIIHHSINTLMQTKEMMEHGPVCDECNQQPQNIRGSFSARLFSFLANARIQYRKKLNGIGSSEMFPALSTNFLSGTVQKNGKNTNTINKAFILDTEETKPRNGTKLAEHSQELEDAFRLLYKKYVDAGFQKYDPSAMRINLYSLLPLSYLLIHNHKGQINGTLTLIRDSHGKLPMNELFFSDLERIRKEDSLICELSGLAVNSTSYAESKAILLSLFQSAFILGFNLLGCTDFCMMVNPGHCKYYEEEFMFNRIGITKKYQKVNGAPAVPMHLSLNSIEAFVEKRNPRLYQAIFSENFFEMQQRLLNELTRQKKLFTTQTINTLQNKKGDLLENLTNDEKELLYQYYPTLLRDLEQ